MRIALVCPVFPPHAGGLADHSLRWAEAVATELGHEVVIVTGPEASAPQVPGLRLAAPFDTWGLQAATALPAALRAVAPDVVVLQYVPQLYERRGFSLGIALAARAVAHAGWPLVTIAHELYFGWDEGLRHLPAGIVQRLALWPLLHASRRTVLSVAAREARLRALFPALGPRLSTLPVGPNLLPLEGVDREAWRARQGIAPGTLVLLTQGGRHPSKDRAALGAALDTLAAEGIQAVLLSIGGDQAGNHPLARSLGHLPEREAREALMAADIALCPFVDGASGRRGSLLNALACGLPTVSTRGLQTDPGLFPPEALRLTRAGDPAAFAAAVRGLAGAPEERQALGQAARAFADAHLAWPVLAQAWGPWLAQAADG